MESGFGGWVLSSEGRVCKVRMSTGYSSLGKNNWPSLYEETKMRAQSTGLPGASIW